MYCPHTITRDDTLKSVFARVLENKIFKGFTDSFIVSLMLQSDDSTKHRMPRCGERHIFHLKNIMELASATEGSRITKYLSALKSRLSFSPEGLMKFSMFLKHSRYNKLLWTENFVRRSWADKQYDVLEEFKTFIRNVVHGNESEEGEICTSQLFSSRYVDVLSDEDEEPEADEPEATTVQDDGPEATTVQADGPEATTVQEDGPEATTVQEDVQEQGILEADGPELDGSEACGPQQDRLEEDGSAEDGPEATAVQEDYILSDEEAIPEKVRNDGAASEHIAMTGVPVAEKRKTVPSHREDSTGSDERPRKVHKIGTGHHSVELLEPPPNYWTLSTLKEALLVTKTHKFKSELTQETFVTLFDKHELRHSHRAFKSSLLQLLSRQVQHEARSINPKLLWVYLGNTMLTSNKKTA